MRLLIFSGSQSPLPVRYPRPTKPLVLPPLIHRALHTALDVPQPSAGVDGSTNTLIIPQPGALSKHSLSAHGDQEQNEITVKIQISQRADTASVVASIRSALDILATLKGLSSIDTLLLGLPEDTDEAVWLDVWKAVTDGQIEHVKHWGTLNLRQPILTAISEVRAPHVNELDVRDCVTLPKEYLAFAASKNIQLWASGGGVGCDPLPSAELHNLLQEFRPKLATISPGSIPSSLSSLIVPSQDGQRFDDRTQPGVQVDWILNVGG